MNGLNYYPTLFPGLFPTLISLSSSKEKEGEAGGLSLLSECKIWSFHILRSSSCLFHYFTCLKVTCCHFI